MFDKQQLNQLYRYSLALCHESNLAYDLLHSALEKYLKMNKSVDEPIAYLRCMMRNQFIDQQRRQQLQLIKHLELVEEIESDSLEDIYLQQEYVESILSGLSYEERELLFLWAVEGYTVQEIADDKKQPKGTLLAKLHRIKKRIKKQLADKGEHPQGVSL